MARSRNIKPGFFDNEILGELPALTRLLFIGLWCLADREGRLNDRPKRIKKELLGYDDVTSEDVDGMLRQLQEHHFIIRYEIDGERYIQVINFLKHQNPHFKEQPSVIPAPEYAESIKSREKEQCPVQARGKPEASPVQAVLIPDSFNKNISVAGKQTTGREMDLGVVADHVKGRTGSTGMAETESHTDRDLQTSPVVDDELQAQVDGKDEDTETKTKPAKTATSPDWKTARTPLEIGFCKFWDAYPPVRKRAKLACWRKWKTIKPEEAMVDRMICTIQAFAKTKEWIDGYVPAPLVWLNQGRWEDECTEAKGHEEQRDTRGYTAGFRTEVDY